MRIDLDVRIHTCFSLLAIFIDCNGSKFSGGIFRIQLNRNQQEILKFAAEGHNLLITGQAGVGKSEVVKRIIATLNERGRTVGIICSSGIACQVYDRGVASTVHSFYGLMTADLAWRQSTDPSPTLVCNRVRAIDAIIWDEASMSSQRMFELVNCLHHELFFEDVGVVEISRQTWIKRNLTGQTMGGVTQFPLVVAVTCHKSQGLTLASAIVHCS